MLAQPPAPRAAPAAPPRAATPSQPPRVAHGPPRRRAQSGAAPIASADV